MQRTEFIDVEAALVTFVRERCRVQAGTLVPSKLPEEFVQVQRVGGGEYSPVTERPMVLVHVWGLKWPQVSKLAALVRSRLMGCTVLADMPVYRVVEVGGLARSPDPDTGGPRFQFTLEFHMRGATRTD